MGAYEINLQNYSHSFVTMTKLTATTKGLSFIVWTVLIISTLTFFICFLLGIFPTKKCHGGIFKDYLVFCKRKALTKFVDNYMRHYEDRIKTKDMVDQKSKICELLNKISNDTKACISENFGNCSEKEIATMEKEFDEEYYVDFASFCYS